MLKDRHLVPVRPTLYAERVCPKCGAGSPMPVGVVFPGVHVLGSYQCASCNYRFLHDLPAGFAVDHDVAIGLDDAVMHDAHGAEPWVTAPLIAGFRSPSDEEVRIERRIMRSCKRVVVLNTLDFLYGHVLLKLWNAQHYLEKHPDLGLIIIMPRSFEWMVPRGTAEVWSVDQRLGKAHGWYRSIDRQVNAFLADYDEVYLGKGYAHPDKSKVDIERYTGVQPFQLENYSSAPRHITFVLREDRLWYRTPLHKLMDRVAGKVGMKRLVNGHLLADQQRLAMSVLRKVRKASPDITATVVGLGDARPLPEGVTDLRTRKMSVDTELAWCAAYARSQFVVGVHGSNMLLPTAFAAGCIEVLPHDRFRNLAQDVTTRWSDVMQLFLYRFVDEFASPTTVARHAISMFNDYAVFHRNNRINIY